MWRKHKLEPAFDIEALLDELQLGLLWDDLPSDVLGALKPSEQMVILNQQRLAHFEANRGLQRFTVGHEIGHWVFHAEDVRSGTIPMLDGGRTWCRDDTFAGGRPPAEIQADLFASYLLMPHDLLKPLLPTAPWRGWPAVFQLAEKFAVSTTAMIVRLEKAGWAHQTADGTPIGGRAPVEGQTSLPLE